MFIDFTRVHAVTTSLILLIRVAPLCNFTALG